MLTVSASVESTVLKRAKPTARRRSRPPHVFAKEVAVQSRGHDKYKRVLGDVVLPEGMNLNHELVKQGWCWWYREYAPTILERLEQDAGADKAACASGVQFHRAVSLGIAFVCTPYTVSSLFIDSPILGRSESSSLDVVVQAERPRQLPTINKQHSALLMLASVGERFMANPY